MSEKQSKTAIITMPDDVKGAVLTMNEKTKILSR